MAVGAVFLAHCVMGILSYRALAFVPSGNGGGLLNMIIAHAVYFTLLLGPPLLAFCAYGYVLFCSSVMGSLPVILRGILIAVISLVATFLSMSCYMLFCLNKYGS